jgi:hypothetical protein
MHDPFGLLSLYVTFNDKGRGAKAESWAVCAQVLIGANTMSAFRAVLMQFRNEVSIASLAGGLQG